MECVKLEKLQQLLPIKVLIENNVFNSFSCFSFTGRSHDGFFNLFSMGKQASTGMKAFVETGRADGLDQRMGNTEGSVFDEFVLPAILSGGGRSEGKIFVDSNHTMVSLVTRIVPSPDWFIGVDSFQVIILF